MSATLAQVLAAVGRAEHTSDAPVYIVATLLFGGILVPVVHRLSERFTYPFVLLVSGGALAASIACGVDLIWVGGPLVHELGGWPRQWGIEFRVDHLSALMVVLINGLSFLVLIFARSALEERLHGRRHFYFALYLLFAMGMSGMCLTGDLFNLYVFLEVTALTGYALIGVGKGPAPFAAFRYIVLGTLAACAYLLGLAYLYGLTGSLNMLDVAERLQPLRESRAALVALAFLITGFGIKAALFPMHAWLPDAYTHAPDTTTAFMAAVGTKVGAYTIFRVLFSVYRYELGGSVPLVADFMGWLAAVAILVGSILAIAQADLKRMLAYSSVSQIGYVLLGFALMNEPGVVGGVLHMVNHAVMKCCLFLVTSALLLRLGHRDIRRFDGAARSAPLAMAVFTLAALSMVGLPPTAGFFSKWYLVVGAVRADRWPFVVVILLSSLLNAVYFFRVLERAYLRKGEGGLEPGPAPARLPWSMALPVGALGVGIVALGLGSWALVENWVRFVALVGAS